MRTLAAGSKGFTLLELLVVVAIMAIATAGVGFALRDTSQNQLEREAQRLAALLESARAQSRMTANPIRWRATDAGFIFEGATDASLPSNWLGTDVQAAMSGAIVLGPEPIIGPQQVRLSSRAQPARNVIISTDGVRPFTVGSTAAVGSTSP